jgi:integration host factor beta subunit
MTKSELINLVAERLPYLTRKDAEIIVNTIFDTMTEALVEEDRIEIRGFGSFKVKQRGDRGGRNPKTGESVQIPAKRMPFFKIGKELYQRINEQHASSTTVSIPHT